MLLSKCGTVCYSHCIISCETTNPSQFLSQYIIESILTGSTIVSFGKMTYSDRNSLSRVIRTARWLTVLIYLIYVTFFYIRMKSSFQNYENYYIAFYGGVFSRVMCCFWFYCSMSSCCVFEVMDPAAMLPGTAVDDAGTCGAGDSSTTEALGQSLFSIPTLSLSNVAAD